jgi:hypothetical protein
MMPRRMLIDPEEWEDVASDLGLGISYWCRELTEAEHQALRDLRLPEMYTVAVMAIDPDNGEDDQLLLMTKRDYEWALGQVEFLAPNSTVSGYVGSAFGNRNMRTNYLETSYLDADVADVVAQLHLFGEIKYG